MRILIGGNNTQYYKYGSFLYNFFKLDFFSLVLAIPRLYFFFFFFTFHQLYGGTCKKQERVKEKKGVISFFCVCDRTKRSFVLTFPLTFYLFWGTAESHLRQTPVTLFLPPSHTACPEWDVAVVLITSKAFKNKICLCSILGVELN